MPSDHFDLKPHIGFLPCCTGQRPCTKQEALSSSHLLSPKDLTSLTCVLSLTQPAMLSCHVGGFFGQQLLNVIGKERLRKPTPVDRSLVSSMTVPAVVFGWTSIPDS